MLYIGNLTAIGSDCLDIWLAPSHYLNQCWIIVNWALKNKLQWNFNQNSYIFIQEYAFENIICEMAAILSQPQEILDWSLNSNTLALSDISLIKTCVQHHCYYNHPSDTRVQGITRYDTDLLCELRCHTEKDNYLPGRETLGTKAIWPTDLEPVTKYSNYYWWSKLISCYKNWDWMHTIKHPYTTQSHYNTGNDIFNCQTVNSLTPGRF